MTRLILRANEVRKLLATGEVAVRREMKPQPHPDFLARGVASVVPQWPKQNGVRWFMNDGLSELVPCPLGFPGERRWVRDSSRPGLATGLTVEITSVAVERGDRWEWAVGLKRVEGE